jgi:8-oxo-dGTP pyrophosphatase MutT (NUDIX family)
MAMRTAKLIDLHEIARTRGHKHKNSDFAESKPARGSHRHSFGHAEAQRSDPRLQSGVLAYRRLDDGQISVLVVGKRHSKKWGIPKGRAEEHLSLADNAAKEAFEEAGVTGRLRAEPLGTYRAMKRVQGLKTLIEVWVYLLEVTATARHWPEKSERHVKWCSPEEAANLLNEPLLAQLCQRLAHSL